MGKHVTGKLAAKFIDRPSLPPGLYGDTITRLFREGPAKVTPGTKMPEQRVTDAEDLQALVEWLGRVTR
jgi:hypothetical protein